MPALNNETVFVELCAGSGILSSTAEKYGMKSCPIDCERNRHSPFTKIFQIDLTDDRAWSFLEHVRDTAKVVAWHMGLPCGTCSQAREIQLENRWSPPPLRDAAHPMGFPWNKPGDKLKVEAANDLYNRAFIFAFMLVQLGHVLTIYSISKRCLQVLRGDDNGLGRVLLHDASAQHLHECEEGLRVDRFEELPWVALGTLAWLYKREMNLVPHGATHNSIVMCFWEAMR